MDYKAIIKNLVIKTLLKLSGLRAWVASFVFNVVWKKVIQPIINSLQTKKEVKDAKDKADKIMDNPNSSVGDVHDAFDDFNKS